MRKVILALLALAVCAVLMGCASKTEFSSTQATAYPSENTMVYNSNVNKVWDAAIKSIGEKFFVLDNIQKDSKIITLSFGADNPDNYIDCGRVTVDTKGMSNSGTYSYAGAQAMATYYVADPGMPHPQPVTRTARLEGKANIVFAEEGKDKTRVTVNARYVLAVKFEGQRLVVGAWTSYLMPTSNSRAASFNTGQEGTLEGTPLRCVTRYTLEKTILEGIKERL